MPGSFDLVKARSLVKKRQVNWRRHALERLLTRGLTRKAIFDVLLTGELIEDYSLDRPVPTCLILGWQQNRPIHVVIAVEDDQALAIITVYEPDLEHFESDFRTRRKR
jgi:hypothetical protein